MCKLRAQGQSYFYLVRIYFRSKKQSAGLSSQLLYKVPGPSAVSSVGQNTPFAGFIRYGARGQ